MKKAFIILAFLSFVFLTGFTSSDQLVIDTLTKRIDTLENNYKSLYDSNIDNTLQIWGLQKYRIVYFDATNIDTTYARHDTDLGMFFITLDKAVKSSTGYKLTFLIGNPQYCTYTGIELSIKYNTRLGMNEKYTDWIKNEKSKDFNLSNIKLLPGFWNPVHIELPVTSINNLGNIVFQMKLNTLSFSTSTTSIIPSGGSTITTPTSSDVIESKIDGDFEGYDYENIYKLQNGQIWQQTSSDYHYHYAYSPDVIIYKSGSSYKMKVDGMDDAVTVKQLK